MQTTEVAIQAGSVPSPFSRTDIEIFLHWHRHGLIPIQYRCVCGKVTMMHLDAESYRRAQRGELKCSCHDAEVVVKLNENAYELGRKILERALLGTHSHFSEVIHPL